MTVVWLHSGGCPFMIVFSGVFLIVSRRLVAFIHWGGCQRGVPVWSQLASRKQSLYILCSIYTILDHESNCFYLHWLFWDTLASNEETVGVYGISTQTFIAETPALTLSQAACKLSRPCPITNGSGLQRMRPLSSAGVSHWPQMAGPTLFLWTVL